MVTTASRLRSVTFGALLVPACAALSSAQSLTTLPDSVIAGRTGSESLLLVIRNSTAESWTRVRFSCPASARVTCRLDRRIPDSVAPRSAISRRPSVIDQSGTAAPGVVLLKLDYMAGDTVGIATASVKLATGRFPRPDEAARIELAGSPASLSDWDTAQVYLSV